MNGETNTDLVLQRIRNRIIDYLELTSSIKEQQKYQEKAPQISVPNEVFNQFEDWASPSWKKDFQQPVFSIQEIKALQTFYAVYKRTADKLPQILPNLSTVSQLKCWLEMEEAASTALEVFLIRGKFLEDKNTNNLQQ